MSLPHRQSNDKSGSPYGCYIFDNAAKESALRFSGLADIFDPGSIRHLIELGVTKGWRCLEVGAGGGSIAAWLCDKVGPSGRVLATDIDTRFLEQIRRSNLDIRRHDVTADPLPESTFDLVHARLVLLHLPGRDKVLRSLLASLKPGGRLLLEEFDHSLGSDPAINPAETTLKTYSAIQRCMVKRGADLHYGRLLAAQLRAIGVSDVEAEGRIFMWQSPSIAADLMRANVEQMRGEVVGAGFVTEGEVEQDLARLADESFMMPAPIMWAVRGRKSLQD